mgnify:FL=1
MATAALFQGLVLGAGMIIPIGAQNSYVLNQGIKRNYHFLTATICMLCDVSLIGLGIFGGGQLIAANEDLMLAITLGGMLFLSIYGGIAFLSAWNNRYDRPGKVKNLGSRRAVIATTLAVTLLNPHVYLDTVMILGSVGGQFEGHEKTAFAVGTMLASVLWFYSLAGCASKLAPWLGRPKVQRGIDITVGLIMYGIAYSLLLSLV